MWQDIKFAVRMLAKAPGFTAVAVLTLALGIGANTAIFSAVNGLILKPLPYTDSSRLVSISGVKLFPNNIMGTVNFSPDVWRRVRAQTPAIEQMALYSHGEFTITGDAAPEVVSDAYVSSDFFPMMGVRPLAGRPILPEDAQPGERVERREQFARRARKEEGQKASCQPAKGAGPSCVRVNGT